MHKRLVEFLNEQKIIYCKQCGFCKGFSTAHAIINLIDNIESAIDNKQFICGVFIDLQKAFDRDDHKILLEKLQHYGIRGTAHQLFKYYLENRQQFISVSRLESELASVNYGVPQGSVLGPLPFSIYIDDLHYAIKASGPLYFAGDTSLLDIQSFIKQINRTLNKDLKQLALWLNVSKILNVAKTEVILFRPKNKQLGADLELKLCRKRLYTTTQVRYLGILIDDKLNRYAHTNYIVSKLMRGNSVLSKLSYVNKEILRTTYFAIFHSYLTYVTTVWGQTRIL